MRSNGDEQKTQGAKKGRSDRITHWHTNTYPQASSDTAHDDGHKVVEITVCWGAQLQCAEADFVQCLIVDTERLVGVLDKLVH